MYSSRDNMDSMRKVEREMEILKWGVLLILGFVMLMKGADIFVDGAAGIAARFGIPQLVIGLTIVAMGTSAPEAAVSIAAALKGNAAITIGNVLGSNLLNILLILGLASIIIPIKVADNLIRIDMPVMIGVMALLAVLGLRTNTITFAGGVILWIVFIAYMAYLAITAKKSDVQEESEHKNKPIWLLLLMTAAGLGFIILGSDFTVDGATGIAKILGISDRVIALTIVALGTSLPELFTSVMAARKGNADIAIGNIVGSNLFNILFVVGTTGLITPVTYSSDFLLDTIFMIAAGVLLWLLVFRKKKLDRKGGMIMMVCYAAYFVYLLLGK